MVDLTRPTPEQLQKKKRKTKAKKQVMIMHNDNPAPENTLLPNHSTSIVNLENYFIHTFGKKPVSKP